MNKQFVVHLTPDQRARLQALLTAGTAPATTHTHARILLKADAAPGGPAWKDVAISDALDVSVRTVVRVRQRFVKAGLERALGRPPRPDAPPRKVDGTVEAHLVALVCSAPPAGRARWTLRLLADRLVELTDLDSIALETVRQTLKKTPLSPGASSAGAYRPPNTPGL
jgi:hypothetical protein